MLRKDLEKSILRRDTLRYVFIGFITPVVSSINMLYLIHVLNAGTFSKTLLGVNTGLAILMGIVLAFLFARFNIRANMGFFLVFLTGAVTSLVMAFTQSVALYLLAALISTFGVFSVQSFQPNIYGFYPKKNRGLHFAKGSRYQSLGLIVAVSLYGFLLKDDNDASMYRTVFLITAFCYVFIAVDTLGFPSVGVLKGKNVASNFKDMFVVLKKDRVFFLLELSWFFIGVGTQMIMPYRANFLAEEKYGYHYSAATILVLLIFIPETVKFIFTPLFSKIFDKYPFHVARIVTNMSYLVFLVLFFLSPNLFVQILSAMTLGFADGLANINGTLFTHKIAKRDDVSLYMLTHRFILGLRSVFIPLVGLYFLEYSVHGVLGASVAFIVLSTLLFYVNIGRFRERM